MNRNGATFLMALFMVMIIGIMMGMTGQSWKLIMKREREKELIFRGNQIKEAIENWYNPNYSAGGARRTNVKPLMDLKDLLEDTNSLQKIKFLPQHYATKLDTKNKKCGSECATLKIYQDPMTGKEWTLIRGTLSGDQPVAAGTGVQNAGIIGVASKSDDEPIRTNFKDTSLENIGKALIGTTPDTAGSIPPVAGFGTSTPQTPGTGGKITKYSEWKFVADPKNDHKRIYRSYHEGW